MSTTLSLIKADVGSCPGHAVTHLDLIKKAEKALKETNILIDCVVTNCGNDKTEPGAFNLPMFRMFADPSRTAGLITDPSFRQSFRFEVWEVREQKKVMISCPEVMYDMLVLIGVRSRYVTRRVMLC